MLVVVRNHTTKCYSTFLYSMLDRLILKHCTSLSFFIRKKCVKFNSRSVFPISIVKNVSECKQVDHKCNSVTLVCNTVTSAFFCQCRYFAVVSKECYTPRLWMMLHVWTGKYVAIFMERYVVMDGYYTF